MDNHTALSTTIPSRAKQHESFPHVVKFSGGRSSAALVFLLAEAGLLDPDRGDVILFANTSAEHPATYRFARECKLRLEQDFGLPFLWFEFCTVEDASRGFYARRPSYRLVRANPIEKDPLGYRSRGEVFEEFLSYQGMLPNPHTRSCTARLKLYPSHELLGEWFGQTDGPPHAGHYGERRFVTPRKALALYRRSRGVAPDDVYMERIDMMTRRPPSRPAQRWQDYTGAPVRKAPLNASPAPMWGHDARTHVTLLGLRADEQPRIGRIMSRSMFAEGASGPTCSVRTQPPGERPCFPLADWGYDETAVRRFWQDRAFDLDLPELGGNCVFCFMKGTSALRRAANHADPLRVPGTPSDVQWWTDIEQKYQRKVPARNGNGLSRFGFFGVGGPSFSDIAAGRTCGPNRYSSGTVACDCTD